MEDQNFVCAKPLDVAAELGLILYHCIHIGYYWCQLTVKKEVRIVVNKKMQT